MFTKNMGRAVRIITIRRSDTIASFFICMKEKDVLVLTFFDTGRHSDLFDM